MVARDDFIVFYAKFCTQKMPKAPATMPGLPIYCTMPKQEAAGGCAQLQHLMNSKYWNDQVEYVNRFSSLLDIGTLKDELERHKTTLWSMASVLPLSPKASGSAR